MKLLPSCYMQLILLFLFNFPNILHNFSAIFIFLHHIWVVLPIGSLHNSQDFTKETKALFFVTDFNLSLFSPYVVEIFGSVQHKI